MKYYLDITLLPSADIPLYFLWEKVYQQLHLALVNIRQPDGRVAVGVSFPEYDVEKFQLGSKLRVFSPSQAELENLNLQSWLSRLSDYVHLTRIRPVPEAICGYACFKRIQTKSNNDRLARRKAKREGMSYQQAQAFYKEYKEKYSRAPYIQMKSQSSGEQYRLMIAQIDMKESSAIKKFSTYGLSTESAIPVF